MPDSAAPSPHICYCTNIHPGETWEEIRSRLEVHAVAAREILGWRELGVGLWISSDASKEILHTGALPQMKRWLDENNFVVRTLNGFPYGNFHGDVVKHEVYRPDWTTERRLLYTLDLVNILAALMPEGAEGSISTLPIGWAPAADDDEEDAGEMLDFAADNLLEVARHLENFRGWHNKFIHLDLEPEPGCLLQRSTDVVGFFEQYLMGRGCDSAVRHHLGVCHDICHAAVMFESQSACLRNYANAGIYVGKVQVSSALKAEFAGRSVGERIEALEALREFREPRYLHQTNVLTGEDVTFHEDLDSALEELGPDGGDADEARVHFHVPIDCEVIGALDTTMEETDAALALLRDVPVSVYEVETYAWDVLPSGHQQRSLAASIAAELSWLAARVARP